MAKYLFLLERLKEDSFALDKVQKMVVASETVSGARAIAAKNAADEGPNTWRDEQQSSCKMIGSFFEQDGLSDLIIRDMPGF